MALEDALKHLVESDPSKINVDRAIGMIGEPAKPRKREVEASKAVIEETNMGSGGEVAISYPEGWNDDKLKEFFVAIKKQARDARAYKEEIRDEVWDLYNNLQDYTQKADWQSKEVRPKVFMMVETVCAFIQLGLFKLRDWFDILPVNPTNTQDKVKAFIVKQILKYYIQDPKFIYELIMAIKWGFLSELMVFKVWEGEEKKYTVEPTFLDAATGRAHKINDELPTLRQRISRRRTVMYAAVNPSYIYLDWTAKNKFVIEEGKMSIAELQDLVDAGLVEDHVDDLISDSGQTLRDVKEDRKRENVTQGPNLYYKEFTYHEYWGDVYDTDGRYVFRNVHFMIANEKYILIKPEVITFYDAEWPYVIAACINVPGSVYHKSLIEPIASMARVMNELLNLTLDAVFATVLNVFEVDVDRVLNVDDLSQGIGPNTVIQKTGSERVLEVTQVGKVPGEAFNGLQYLETMLETDTAITRGMVGVPQTNKRQTKGEVEQQAEFTSTFFQAFIQNIENNFLSPLIKKVWFRILQFPSDMNHPNLADLIGPEAARIFNMMTAQERYDSIQGDYEVRVTGLSELVAKRQVLGDVITLMRVIGRSPDMMAWVDPKKLLFEIFDLLNLDPQTILRPKPVAPMNMRPGMSGQPGQKPPGQPGQRAPRNGGGNTANLQQMLAAMGGRGGSGGGGIMG